jgi:hypothetical protein
LIALNIYFQQSKKYAYHIAIKKNKKQEIHV